MPPEDTSKWIQDLLTIGGQAGVLWVALYYLLKVLKSQYDVRITVLESRSDRCDEDRKILHSQMHALEREHTAALERWIDKLDRLKPTSMPIHKSDHH